MLTEISDEEFIWSQFFPRAAAVSERAFKEASWETSSADSKSWDVFNNIDYLEDFNKFRYALTFFLRDLEDQGIPYHLPKPGAKVKTDINGNQYYAFNSMYKDHDILFRKSGETDWVDYETARG